MYYLVLLVGCLLAFAGGAAMLFSLVYWTQGVSTFRACLTFFAMPMSYWLGVMLAFLCGLGAAFKP